MKVFISYSVEDKKEAGQLYDRLTLLGFTCFLAHRDIPKGAKWQDTIIDELKASNVFIPILTEKALSSAWAQQECGMAHFLRINKKNILIIPLTVDRNDPPGCLAVYQAIRADTQYWGFSSKVRMDDELVMRLALEILKQTPNPEQIKDELIDDLRSASWRETEYLLEFLYRSGVQSHEFLKIIAACGINSVAASSDRAMGYLFNLLRAHEENVNLDPAVVKVWNQLYRKYEARKREEQLRAEEEQRRWEELRQKERVKKQQTLTTPPTPQSTSG